MLYDDVIYIKVTSYVFYLICLYYFKFISNHDYDFYKINTYS